MGERRLELSASKRFIRAGREELKRGGFGY
jgi:hypothetical protein